jgi:hypothetical protein
MLESDFVVSLASTATFEAIHLGRVGLLVDAPASGSASEVWTSPNLHRKGIARGFGYLMEIASDPNLQSRVEGQQRRLAERVISSRSKSAATDIAHLVINDIEALRTAAE